MTHLTPEITARIDALTVSAEFILCAVRSMALGCDPEGKNVSDPLAWAKAKLDEGMRSTTIRAD
jgi:hypothetical protein